MEKINATIDGLEFVNDAGRKVVIRTNHSATSDQYIDLPSSGGVLSTSAADGNDLVKVSANDTTAGYLNGKLVAGTGVTLTEGSDGSNETLTISAEGGGGGSAAEYYDVTLRDCENTTDLINVMEITVPANTWEDGQAIVFDFAFNLQNTTGDSASIYAAFSGTGFDGVDLTGTIGSYTFLKRSFFRVYAMRVGNGALAAGKWLNNSGYSFANSTFADMSTIVNSGWQDDGSSIILDSSVNFTTDITLAIKYQFSIARSATWLRPIFGSAYKTAKGASS